MLPQDRKPLGLGLGLGGAGRTGFRDAVRTGSLDSWLGERPRANRRFDARLAGGPNQQAATSAQEKNQVAGNAGQPPAAAPAPAPPAAPAPTTPAAPGTPPSGAPSGGSFMDFLNNAFGAGNPFGMRPGTYSDPGNPMYGAAKANLDQALAGIRARFAGSGLGNSGRAALSEGQAAADFGNQIAMLGETAYQNDASRALSAGMGGQQNLLAANAQLGNAGAQVTGLGQGEQTPPGLAALLQLIAALAGQSGTDDSFTKGRSGPLPGM